MARRLLILLTLCAVSGCDTTAQEICRDILPPEQRTIDYRDPAQLPPSQIPNILPPRTVTDPRPRTPEWQMSLNEAIRIALENAKVVRVLTGTTAVSSGQTIYDAAITNTTIDQAQATFDPVAAWNNTWSRTNTPVGEFFTPGGAVLSGVNGTTGSVTPGSPASTLSSIITSTPTDSYVSDASLSKSNVLGGKWSLDWTSNPTRIAAPGPFPLNPQSTNAVTLSYTQPLLQGAGFKVNMAPILITRLNTEQSFFQYKDSTEELVRSVIAGYWNLVQARIVAWAAKIQVEQSGEAFRRAEAQLKTGLAALSDVAQARVTYTQFKAALVADEANVLTQEGALRNLLGLAPNDDRKIVPVSAPTSQRLRPEWDPLIQLAVQRRPDIVELKIITEADQQRLIIAEDQTLPKLNAVAAYTWNGLEGELPNGATVSTAPGQFTTWSVGVNFSVPLGLRQGRAQVRQQKLIIARDRANEQQGVHAAFHQLAGTVRDLDSAYEQYLAFKETRDAATINLRTQFDLFKQGGPKSVIYLNVLQALNDWGNAVSSEAQQLLAYNIALATLERQTGTILETHGLVFVEERFRAAGPLLCRDRLYPSAQPLVGSPQLYPGTGEPAENSFDLRNPVTRDKKPPEEELPKPRLLPPAP
jgi:outer membrane protein TolC